MVRLAATCYIPLTFTFKAHLHGGGHKLIAMTPSSLDRFTNCFTKKKIRKSVKIRQNCGHDFVVSHFWPTLYMAHTHTRLAALCLGLPGTRKVTPIWVLLKQETVSGSGISWAVCKSAPFSSQITMPATHHSVFYRPDALPATQPTASKH